MQPLTQPWIVSYVNLKLDTKRFAWYKFFGMLNFGLTSSQKISTIESITLLGTVQYDLIFINLTETEKA